MNDDAGFPTSQNKAELIWNNEKQQDCQNKDMGTIVKYDSTGIGLLEAPVYPPPPKPISFAPSEGIKHDQGKPDFSMISYELMEQVSRVREFGAKKYERSNWKKGFKVTRSCAAALRHIFKFLSGETQDPESGLSHLAHAVCGLEHAIYDMIHHPKNDDRDKIQD